MPLCETRNCENALQCTGPLNAIHWTSDYNISSSQCYDDNRVFGKKKHHLAVLNLSSCCSFPALFRSTHNAWVCLHRANIPITAVSICLTVGVRKGQTLKAWVNSHCQKFWHHVTSWPQKPECRDKKQPYVNELSWNCREHNEQTVMLAVNSKQNPICLVLRLLSANTTSLKPWGCLV